MFIRRPLLSVLRHRLSRRLTLIAVLGLGAAGGLVSVAALGMVLALTGCREYWAEGAVLLAAGAAALAVVDACLCLRLLAIMFASPPTPDGVYLPVDAAHGLHRLIVDMARQFRSRPIDHVWITSDMNVAVLQRPRWGRVGPVETHLLVGLPLVHCVSGKQLMAVLAHEMAHLVLQRRGLGKYGALLRAWCLRVHDGLADALPMFCALGDGIQRRFYYDMTRLTRLEEFEADAQAAHMVGAGLLGETLIELSLKEQFLRRDYWLHVLAQSECRARPLVRPYRDMGLGLAAGFLRLGINDDLIRESEAGAGGRSLHPTLRERLRALRVYPRPAALDRPSAARQFLSPILPTLAWAFDRAWWESTRSDWRLNYQGARRRDRDVVTR
jgi:Zn-dependent protease with chaperone function